MKCFLICATKKELICMMHGQGLNFIIILTPINEPKLRVSLKRKIYDF
jgi:hypothetical protein